MLVVISPAKALDFDTKSQTRKHSQPQFLDESKKLVRNLKKLSPGEVSDLMGISTKLGELNCNRYNEWALPFTHENAKQALLAFKGDVYKRMRAWDFTERDFTWAQKHVRILSGLYGLLKPLDLIQPYRLEMGTRFANSNGKDLYAFWGTKLSIAVGDDLLTHRSKVLVNLASNEYFNSLDTAEIGTRIVTPMFMDRKNGRHKTVSFFAKKARGAMTSFIVKNRINTVKGLKDFDCDGYRFSEDRSSADDLVFLRE
jgi:cytoplasmic iron level regulating protein YaaA (DUF328/UPF0246 family)